MRNAHEVMDVDIGNVIEFLQHPKMPPEISIQLDIIKKCFERGCFRLRHEDDMPQPDHVLMIEYKPDA